MRRLVVVPLLLAAGVVQAQVSSQCAAAGSAPALTGQSALFVPLAPELAPPARPLGAPSGVLAQALDESMSVDQILLRIRLEGCLTAKAAPIVPGMPSSTDPGAYKPKTAFDNTPWRFDMNQNGKRMTADEFSAWMKSRGVRVARGAGAATPPPAPPIAPPEQPVPDDKR